jgi:hypothetical protein
MSRCRSCNNKMTDSEMCRKVYSTAQDRIEYTDLCYHCGSQDNWDVDYYLAQLNKQNQDEE